MSSAASMPPVGVRAPIARMREASAALGDHVIDVGLPIAKEKVIWSHARRGIAAVENPQPIRDGAEVDFPGDAMSRERCPAEPATERSIASSQGCSRPQPTVVCLIDLRPKSLLYRLGFRPRVHTHILLVSRAS